MLKTLSIYKSATQTLKNCILSHSYRRIHRKEDRDIFDILREKFYYRTSSQIYSEGSTGLLDLGPIGSALKKNILKAWEEHFVVKDDILEIESCIISPKSLWQATGHTRLFSDSLVHDSETNESFRLKHLVHDFLEEICYNNSTDLETIFAAEEKLKIFNSLSDEDLVNLIDEFNIKSPKGNLLTPPQQINLLFETKLGSTGKEEYVLRPELSQGMFVNFKALVSHNNNELPFGVAQIGKAFRNEISPKGNLLRLREFTLAEIAYFYDSEKPQHPKLSHIHDISVNIVGSNQNLKTYEEMTLRNALEKGLITNEILAYYLGYTKEFLTKLGIDPARMRFRQHAKNEMAHYAMDCWDCECLTSVGWIECFGCADRSFYDLDCHSSASGQDFSIVNRSDGRRMLASVIEPSFGIDRIMHIVLEHSLEESKGSDISNYYFKFPSHIAPVNCAVMSLTSLREHLEKTQEIVDAIKKTGIRSVKWNGSFGSIGKRYKRCDQGGIMFAITVDKNTVQDNTVTIRYVVTGEQIRVPNDVLVPVLKDLLDGNIGWDEAKSTYELIPRKNYENNNKDS